MVPSAPASLINRVSSDSPPRSRGQPVLTPSINIQAPFILSLKDQNSSVFFGESITWPFWRPFVPDVYDGVPKSSVISLGEIILPNHGPLLNPTAISPASCISAIIPHDFIVLTAHPHAL